MTYARARWSDAQHAVSILFDRCEGNIHYVEILTGHHKTMRALQHRHQFLPLIAPAGGCYYPELGITLGDCET